jgi:hypothetical protein
LPGLKGLPYVLISLTFALATLPPYASATTAPICRRGCRPQPPISYPYALRSRDRITDPTNLVSEMPGDDENELPPVPQPPAADATVKAVADIASQLANLATVESHQASS